MAYVVIAFGKFTAKSHNALLSKNEFLHVSPKTNM